MAKKPAKATPGNRRATPQRRKRTNPLVWVLPVVVIALVGIVVFALVRGRDTGKALSDVGRPVPADVLAALTQVPPSTWTAAGAMGVTPPVAVPPTDASNPSMPQVLYIGAEYCPFCAVERWPLIVALSRFGRFEGLKLSASSPTDVYPNTPSFTFHGSSYSSQYLKLETVETHGRTPPYQALETPTASQMALLRKYDAPPYVSAQSAGAIPFLLIGQTYLWVGASYPAQTIQGGTWQSISAKLASADDPIGKAVNASANMITAAICELNGGQPVDVCTNPGVQAAAALLPAPVSR